MRRIATILLLAASVFAEDEGLAGAIRSYLAMPTEDELVVEGERIDSTVPHVQLNETGSHDVVTPERVRESTPITVEGIARRLPGVSSRLYSGDEYLRPSISMRGMPDNGFTEYTAVHVDGINYSTLFYGWTALSIFPFTAERIYAAEVYRGAHAIRYGPNTIAGVVNLVTRPIPEKPTVMMNTVFGSYNYFSGHMLIGNTWKESGWGGLLEYVQKGGDTFRADNEFDVSELAGKLRKTVGDNGWIQVNGFYWRDVHQLPARLTLQQLMQDPTQNPTERRIDWHGYAWGLDGTYHADFGPRSWLDVRVYFRKAVRALDSGRPRTGPPFDSVRNADSDNYNTGVQLRGQQALGEKHVLYYGVRYHYEQIDRMVTQVFDDGSPTDLQSDTKTWTHAFSAHVDDTIYWERITLQFGARMEWIPEMRGEDAVSGNSQDFDFFEIFPGASINYKTTDNTALFANYHRSFRAPQTWAFDFSGSPQDFEFERGQNVEVGWRWQNFHGNAGSIVLWYVDFSNFIDFDDVTMNFTNIGGFESYGIDFSLSHDFGPQGLPGFSVWGTVTLQDSEIQSGQFTGNTTPFVPDSIFDGGLRYAHAPTGLYGVFEALYQGSSWVNPENNATTPAYWLFNTRIGWRTVHEGGSLRVTIDVALGIKNLFDEDYYLRHNATLYVPGQPRQFFGNVSLVVEF